MCVCVCVCVCKGVRGGKRGYDGVREKEEGKGEKKGEGIL